MKSLLFVATAMPLVLAGPALAETRVSTARTTSISTSSAANGQPDDVSIEKAGSIKLGQAGVAVTVDSANKFKNDGEIAFEDRNDSTGILLTPGVQGSVDNNGVIRLVEDYTAKDDDKDGDLDGPFATGANRYGIRLGAGGTFTGNVTSSATGSITVEGNDSAGILLQGRLQGNLANAGAIIVTGDRSVGLSAASVSGDVRVTGSVIATGADTTAVALGDVGGLVQLQSVISATGYRATERLGDAARAKLDDDDLRQGGAAVRISGSVGGGILLDRPPADADKDDKDEDKDGVPDADEKTASLSSFGSAPALDIGGAVATTIGRVGTGDSAYGLVIKGQVSGAGVNDGVSATAIRIGQAGGGATTVDGGINIVSGGGAVAATAFGASATSILLNAGARADELRNGGDIRAAVTSDGLHNATAVLIHSGATMATLRNSGTITASLAGESGDAVAILDRSGTLSLIENSGRITATITPTDDANDKDDSDTDPSNEVVTGRAVVADLSANTTGAIVRQSKASATAADPSMTGNLIFGSGADRLELLAGTYKGTLSFGAGADSLLIDGGASATARLVDTDGTLAVEVKKGSLTVTNGEAVRLGSLNVGAEGALALTIDPAASTATRFEVTGTAAIASGAKINLTMTSLVRGTKEYEVIRAGTLAAGAATTTLSGAPYLYTTSLRQDENRLYIGVRAKTAAELELNRSATQGYAAIYDRLDSDKRIEAAFLGASDRGEFLGLYNQMLPDHSGASLISAAAISSAISSAMNQPLQGSQYDEKGLAVWGQEIFFHADRDAEDAAGFKSKGVGFAAGLERISGGHAFGVSTSFVSADYKDRWAAADERTAMQFAEAGLYWRTEQGRFRANARGGIGYVWFDGDRKLVSEADALKLTSSAKWNGWLADAHAGASYDLGQGWFVARPELSVDYLHLKEQGYRESGGGAGFDLDVDSRSGSLLTGTAALAIGARFGTDFRWGPEVQAGWRQRLSGNAGTTTARFVSGGSDFALSPEALPDGEAMVKLAFRAESDGIAFAIEGGKSFHDVYDQYSLRAIARFTF